MRYKNLYLVFLGLVFFAWPLQMVAQQNSFRLQVQPARAELTGDGSDYTTVVITARDSMGEIDTRVNGALQLRINAGILQPMDVRMVKGVAVVNLIAPVFGTPVKGANHLIYFMFKFMKVFTARSGSTTNPDAMKSIASKAVMETLLSGTENPFTMLPGKNGEDFIYIVAEMNGVKGKAKIKLLKGEENPNGSILPGIYVGKDIMGGATWTMEITSAGQGFLRAGGGESNTVLFTNDASKEMNDALGKLYGIGGFRRAYLGPPPSETRYVPNFDIRTMGMETPYLPMPKNGVFIYVPPILLEYQGNSNGTGSRPVEEKPRSLEKIFVEVVGNQLIGDGKSQTTALFRYLDEKGKPVAGKRITWKVDSSVKILQAENTTNANGEARAILQAPVLKTEKAELGSTLEYKDPSVLYELKVLYQSGTMKNDYASTIFSIYKTIERKIRIVKPGFEIEPIKVLLPLIRNYTFESEVFALIEPFKLPSIPDRFSVFDAAVVLESDKFDEGFFRSDISLLKKNKKDFAGKVRDIARGFVGFTDKSGRFKMKVGKGSEKVIKIEPFEVKLSDLTGRRKGSLLNVIDLINDESFTAHVRDAFYKIDRELCQEEYLKAVYLEEKLHILGGLMTHANNASKYMGDTNEELLTKAWEAISMLAEWANEKWKISKFASKKLEPYTKKLEDLKKKAGDRVGYNQAAKAIDDLKQKLDSSLVNKITGYSYKQGVSGLIKRFLYTKLSNPDDRKGARMKCTKQYYELMGEAGNSLVANYLQAYIDTMSSALSDYLVPASAKKFKKGFDKAIEENLTNPYEENIGKPLSEATDVKTRIKKAMIGAYYASLKTDIQRYLNLEPEKIHGVYDELRPVMLDRSKDLGTYYLSVANWRYNSEMAVAYKDLFADIVLKGAVIIAGWQTGQFWEIPGHLEKIEKAKKALNAVYTATALANEIYSYNQLWAEASSAFVYANHLIYRGRPGAGTKSILSADFHWPDIVPHAYAAVVPLSLPGIYPLNEGGLDILNDKDVLDKLKNMYTGLEEMEAWIEMQLPFLLQMSIDEPERVSAFLEKADNYADGVHTTGILALALIDNPESDHLLRAFLEQSKTAARLGKDLTEGSRIIIKGLDQLEKNANTPANGIIVGQSIHYIYFILAAVSLISLLAAWYILNRKKRKRNKIQDSEKISAKESEIVQPGIRPEQQKESKWEQNRPKFCPQCGNIGHKTKRTNNFAEKIA